MQANRFLEGKAADCRRLAAREREPAMAQALRELAEVYEHQLQCGSSARPQRQMR